MEIHVHHCYWRQLSVQFTENHNNKCGSWMSEAHKGKEIMFVEEGTPDWADKCKFVTKIENKLMYLGKHVVLRQTNCIWNSNRAIHSHQNGISSLALAQQWLQGQMVISCDVMCPLVTAYIFSVGGCKEGKAIIHKRKQNNLQVATAEQHQP